MSRRLSPGVPRHYFILPVVLMATACLFVFYLSDPARGAQPGSAVDRFVDDDRSVHEGSINAIAEEGLVKGCNPPANDRFCPDKSITRGEMATILSHIISAETSPANPFIDTARSVHVRSISRIAEAGVTYGCNPPRNDRYCPGATVTRGQMAAFIGRALELPDGSKTFIDTAGHVFEKDVARLAKAGITVGCNPPDNDRFCPDRRMTRGEMATMVARALGLDPITIDHPDPDEPGDPDDPAPPDDPVGPPGWKPAYPGEPPPGSVAWGASLQGGADPKPRHEDPSGYTMVLRRSFFQWRHRTDYMIRTIEDDIVNGRQSWVSIKTPSWAAMGAGQHDAEIDAMLRALGRLDTNVWLTLHHEPEGGGGVNEPDDPSGPSGHLAMNRRVRQRMNTLGIKNVSLAPILMTWTWDPRSGRNPDEWWDRNVYDFIGVDHYMDAEASLLIPRWFTVRQWAEREGVNVAVGEWGMRGIDAAAGQRMREWYDHAANSHRDGRGARVVGLAAFDSGNNSPTGSWELQGYQLTTFHQLLGDPRTFDPS